MEQLIKQGPILEEDIVPGMYIGYTMYSPRTGDVEQHREGIVSYQDGKGTWFTHSGSEFIDTELTKRFRGEFNLLTEFIRVVPDPRSVIEVVNSRDTILIGEQMYVTDDGKLLTDSENIWDALQVLEFNYVYNPQEA